MTKEWRVFAHPDYLVSFRRVVMNPDERFLVTTEIRDRLKVVENPSQDFVLVPGESEQYEFDVMRYTVIVQWKEEAPNDIRLLEIYKTE